MDTSHIDKKCTHKHTNTQTHTHTQTYKHTQTHKHTNTQTHKHTNTNKLVCTNTCIHAHLHPRAGVGKLLPAGHMWPAMRLSTACKSLQQIQKKSTHICQSQMTRNTISMSCLCWTVNVFLLTMLSIFCIILECTT